MSTADTPNGASAQLQSRARRLRARAASLHPLLADTYRRRAAELDLQALLEAVWNPPMVWLPTDGPEGTPIVPVQPATVGLAA
jgi:hypothetical protein